MLDAGQRSSWVHQTFNLCAAGLHGTTPLLRPSAPPPPPLPKGLAVDVLPRQRFSSLRPSSRTGPAESFKADDQVGSKTRQGADEYNSRPAPDHAAFMGKPCIPRERPTPSNTDSCSSPWFSQGVAGPWGGRSLAFTASNFPFGLDPISDGNLAASAAVLQRKRSRTFGRSLVVSAVGALRSVRELEEDPSPHELDPAADSADLHGSDTKKKKKEKKNTSKWRSRLVDLDSHPRSLRQRIRPRVNPKVKTRQRSCLARANFYTCVSHEAAFEEKLIRGHDRRRLHWSLFIFVLPARNGSPAKTEPCRYGAFSF